MITSIQNELNLAFASHMAIIVLNIFMLIACYTDIKYMKIYNKFNIVLLITRVLISPVFPLTTNMILGGILIFLTFLMAAMYTGDKMAGDIKFGGNVGLWLGMWPSFVYVILTVILNLIFRFFTKNKKAIALAPFFYLSYLILLGVFVYLNL